MLTNKVRRRIELPHEPDSWIEVRQLSYLQLDLAREVVQMRAMQTIGKLALTPEATQSIAAARLRAPDAELPALLPPPDPLAGYDMQTLLQAGVVAWSYDEDVTPEAIDNLDEETAELVARALVIPERSEADRKNGSSRSTKPSTVTALRPGSG